MARTIPQEELLNPGALLAGAVGKETLFLERNGIRVAAIVSMLEYESTHEAKVERAIAAMDAFGAHMAAHATQGELEQLVKELDTHEV